MPRYIIYFIQYKSSLTTDLIILDISSRRRIRSISPFRNNNRPTKKFTPKLIENIKTDTYIFVSSPIEYFTKVLSDRLCWDTTVDMEELISLIKTFEIMISMGEEKKVTKLYIIP